MDSSTPVTPAQPPVPKALKPTLIGVGCFMTLAALTAYAFDCERNYLSLCIGLFVLGLSAAAMGFALQKTVGKVLLIFALVTLVGFGFGFLAFISNLHLVCRI